MAWASFFLLALFGVIRWSVAVIAMSVIFALGFILFPYVTPFTLVHEKDADKKSAAKPASRGELLSELRLVS
jgi:hypothetical protein